MVTIQDVARAAEVSPMTVSNVLNNHPHVRDETRARVVAAMDELGYRVNVAARNLRAGRTKTIGFAVPQIDMPYFGQLAARLIEEAGAQGYRIAIEETRADRESELDAIVSSRNRLYDGLIMTAVGLSDRDQDLLRVDSPTVLLGESLRQAPIDHIALPNEEGFRAATQHLIDQGCSRLAVVVGMPSDTLDVSTRRLDGFLRALADQGIEHDPTRTVRVPELSLESGRAAAEALCALPGGFDGVVCVTDTVALGVMRGLVDNGRRIPDDVRVIGFDGLTDGLYSVPRLSTITPDHKFVAALAIERLLQQINDRENWTPTEFVAEYALDVRESSR